MNKDNIVEIRQDTLSGTVVYELQGMILPEEKIKKIFLVDNHSHALRAAINDGEGHIAAGYYDDTLVIGFDKNYRTWKLLSIARTALATHCGIELFEIMYPLPVDVIQLIRELDVTEDEYESAQQSNADRCYFWTYERPPRFSFVDQKPKITTFNTFDDTSPCGQSVLRIVEEFLTFLGKTTKTTL